MEETSKDLELFHYGVKGMKWGVRKEANTSEGRVKKTSIRERYNSIRNKELRSFTVKAKNGKEVQVQEDRTPALGAFILSLKKDAVKLDSESGMFSFKVDGKRVGEASFSKKNDEELNLQWLGVKSSERGKGYGSAVFDSAVEYGRAEGYKRLTLEVPGKSPDARHIYEKRGFKVVKEPSPEEIAEDPIYGGLTHMALEIDDVKHSSISEDEEIEKALIQTFPQLPADLEETVFREENLEPLPFTNLTDSAVFHMSQPNDLELFHYGVKGMKWGIRRDKPAALQGVPRSTNRAAKKDARESAKAKMFYGEGAGTRRKLIKAKVESRSKDAAYKRAYEHHLGNQNMAKRASQARGERKRKDTVAAVGKTARGVKNLALGTGASVSLGAVVAYSAYKNPRVRQTVSRAYNATYREVANSPITKSVSSAIKDRFRN